MISYTEFIERVMNLNVNINKKFLTTINKSGVNMTNLELVLLMKIDNQENITPKKLFKKGSIVFNHLRFLLNSLESKKLIYISSNSMDLENSILKLENKGSKIKQIFNSFKMEEKTLEDLKGLETFTNELSFN